MKFVSPLGRRHRACGPFSGRFPSSAVLYFRHVIPTYRPAFPQHPSLADPRHEVLASVASMKSKSQKSQPTESSVVDYARELARAHNAISSILEEHCPAEGNPHLIQTRDELADSIVSLLVDGAL